MIIILETEALKRLLSDTLPDSSPNPYFGQMQWHTATKGVWIPENSPRLAGPNLSGKQRLKRQIEREGGQNIPDATFVYTSELPPNDFQQGDFSPQEITDLITLVFSTWGFEIETVLQEMWVEIPDANYDDQVPNYLPNSGVTWRNWQDATHNHQQFQDNGTAKWAVPLNSNNDSQWVAGTVFGRLISTDGFIVKWMKDYPQPPEEPGPQGARR